MAGEMEQIYVKGTCQSMCSKSEAHLRQKEKLLHKFEMKQGTESNETPDYDPDKVVKCFNRSAAGRETTNPSNLRPFPVLMKTIEYLFKEIFPIHKKKPIVVYNFMFDRFRAVRQDAVIQNLPSAETIQILEPIARFLMYFSYFLIEENVSDFDPQINNTHLQECLKKLLVCYDECEDCDNPNRWDIESSYLLFNLGNFKPLARGTRLCKLNTNENYINCIKLSFHWYLRNYIRVCKLIKTLPPLLLCVVSSSIPEIRKYSLRAMSYAFSSSNSAYPVSNLKSLLLYEKDSQVVEDCNYFNIKVTDGYVNFLKNDFDTSIKCRQGVRLKWVDDILLDCDLISLLYVGNS